MNNRALQQSKEGAIRQRTLFRLAATAITLLLAGLIFFSVLSSSHGRKKEGGYFAGQIPGVGTVFLNLQINGTNVTGSAAFGGGPDTCQLEGEREASGQFRILAVSYNHDDERTNGLLIGMTGGKPSFRGQWTTNGGNPVAIELQQIASSMAIKRKTGLHIGRYGGSQKYEAEFPVFSSLLSFHQDVNRRLRAEANADVAGFFAESTVGHVIQGFRMPGAANEYEGETSFFAVYYSDRLAILRKFEGGYTGGAHGYGSSSGVNFVADNGKARELRLADLFQPGTAWERCLSDLCLVNLKKQKASSVVDGLRTNLTVGDLSSFNISPRGLIVYFAPYAVASYAEGEFTVVLSWESLRGYIRSNSLPEWPDTPQKGMPL